MTEKNDRPFSWIVYTEEALRILERFSVPTTVLDIGSGSESFKKQTELKGYQVTTVDYESGDIKIDLNKSWPPALKEGYSVVTAWHVLEHLENPFHFFREAHSVLKPGGLLFVSIPNIGTLKNRINFLFHLDFPRWYKNPLHITSFTKATFTRAFKGENPNTGPTQPLFEKVEDGYMDVSRRKDFYLTFLIKKKLAKPLFSKTYWIVLRRK